MPPLAPCWDIEKNEGRGQSFSDCPLLCIAKKVVLTRQEGKKWKKVRPVLVKYLIILNKNKL
jgi:hypothetical protein